MDTLTVRFHFSGEFLNDGKGLLCYRGGREATSVIDRDKVSLPEVRGSLQDHCQVKEGTLLHWLSPGKDLSTGLRALVDDKSCLEMSDCIVEGNVAEIYVEDPPPVEEIGEEELGHETYAMEEPDVIERPVSRPSKRAGRQSAAQKKVLEREFYSMPFKRAGRSAAQKNVLERGFYSRPFKRAGRQSADKEVVDSSTRDSGSFTCASPGGMGKDDGGSKKRAHADEDDGSSEKRARIGGNDGSSKKRVRTDEDDDAIRVAKKAHIGSGRSGSGDGVSNAAADNIDLEECFCLLSRVTPFEDGEWIRDKFIVAEEIDLDTILFKIEKLLEKAALSIVTEDELPVEDRFSYEVPARNPHKKTYLGTHGIVHERGATITFDFTKNFHKAIQMTCALSVIAESIKEGLPLPKRFVYYRYKGVFGSDEVAYTMLDHICCMFGCSMSSLNIFIERKGRVIGPLEVQLRDKSTLDCSHGFDGEGSMVPRTSSIVSFKHRAKHILLVEKKSIFHHLFQTKFHIKQNCIMITGGGEADTATRSFLNRLHAATKLPVYALMDPDPFGVQILFVYAFGSVNMSYANYGLAVPDIIWLGLWHSDLEDVELSDTYFSKTTASEKSMLNNLLGHNIPGVPAHWETRMLPMLERKAPMEALFSVGFLYLSNTLLPKLLAKRASEPTQLEEATQTEEIMSRSDGWQEEER